MKNRQSLIHWISRQQKNYPLIALITFGFPRLFTRWLLSENRGRNPWQDKTCFTLSFDCDYPEDVSAIPGLLKILDRLSLKGSFACVGYWIEKYPDEHKMILDYGHEILNHTYSHPDNEILNPGRKFKYIPRNEKKEEIEKCHDICIKVLQYEPAGCRIPHFKNLFTPEIYAILSELGYTYSTSTWLTNTTTGGIPFIAQNGIVEFPLTTCPKHPFTVFDSWHVLNSPRWTHRIVHRKGEQDYVKMFNLLIDYGLEYHCYLNLYIDPLDLSKMMNFQKMLARLNNSKIDVVTYEDYLREYAGRIPVAGDPSIHV